MKLSTWHTLGDYELVEPLSDELTGPSYMARHRYLQKLFWIKVLPEEISEHEAFLERFKKTAALLATLDHPNLIKLHGASQAEGRYFLSYEQEGGLNLADFLDNRGPLNEEEIFLWASQLASALDYAHTEKGLYHGGINLKSLFIGQEKEIRLADLGLNRLIHEAALLTKTYKLLWEQMLIRAGLDPEVELLESSEVNTLASQIFSTYAFLAPEQKNGGDSSPASDSYAFGVLIYYLLIGHLPETLLELPSHSRPDLKYHWDNLIASCLQTDPQKRPLLLSSLCQELLKSQGTPRVVLKPGQIARPEYDPDPAAAFQVDTTVGKYTPKLAENKSTEPLLTEMVVIPGGYFSRGSQNGARDEMPCHQVHLSSFAIDIHPVTNEQFVRFLEAMGGEKDSHNNDMIRLRDSRIKRLGGKFSIESGYSKHPVVGVSWYGALAYAAFVGKRLPTEAEWEIAACGGMEGMQYPTGANIERSEANFFSSDTTAVQSYPPNGYGLYDMAGNVYEWCQDWYGYNYYETSIQEPNDPQGPLQGVYRVLRGGCWKSLKEDLRCGHRHRNNPGIMNGTYGFRCVADVS